MNDPKEIARKKREDEKREAEETKRIAKEDDAKQSAELSGYLDRLGDFGIGPAESYLYLGNLKEEVDEKKKSLDRDLDAKKDAIEGLRINAGLDVKDKSEQTQAFVKDFEVARKLRDELARFGKLLGKYDSVYRLDVDKDDSQGIWRRLSKGLE